MAHIIAESILVTSQFS